MSLAAAELDHALAAHTASRTSFASERALEAQTDPGQLTVPTSPFSTLPVFRHTGLPMHDGVDTAVVLSCVGNAICDAVISFRKVRGILLRPGKPLPSPVRALQGDYSTCATLLLPVRHHVQVCVTLLAAVWMPIAVGQPLTMAGDCTDDRWQRRPERFGRTHPRPCCDAK